MKGAFVIFITFECAAVESVTAVPECHISSPFFIKMQNTINRLDSLKKYEVQNWDKKLHLDSSRELRGANVKHSSMSWYLYIYIYGSKHVSWDELSVLCSCRGMSSLLFLSLSLCRHTQRRPTLTCPRRPLRGKHEVTEALNTDLQDANHPLLPIQHWMKEWRTSLSENQQTTKVNLCYYS